MRETEIRAIVGWAQSPGERETVLKGHSGETQVVKAEKRTIKVRVPEGYPIPNGEADGIYQNGRTVIVMWGADKILTAREIGDPPNSQFVAIQMSVISQGDEDGSIPRSFLYVFGTEERPRAVVMIERPIEAPDTDWLIVVDSPAPAHRQTTKRA